MATTDLNDIRIGDKIEFRVDNQDSYVGMITGKFKERTPEFQYYVSVRTKTVNKEGLEEDEDSEKYTYLLDRELHGRNYVFMVSPCDVVKLVRKHKSNIDRVEKEEKK